MLEKSVARCDLPFSYIKQQKFSQIFFTNFSQGLFTGILLFTDQKTV